MISKNNPKIEYSDINIGGTIIPKDSFIDINTGVKPYTTTFHVFPANTLWSFVSNFWTGSDGNIMVTIVNPMDFDITESSGAYLRVFWLG